jgi:hypothetical protein
MHGNKETQSRKGSELAERKQEKTLVGNAVFPQPYVGLCLIQGLLMLHDSCKEHLQLQPVLIHLPSL